MARKQFLINYHTGGKDTVLDLSKVKLGEIVVRHNEEKPELYTKLDDDKFATFIDSVAVDTKISDVSKTINSTIEAFSGATVARFNGIDTKFNDYDTKTQVADAIADAKVEVYASANTYTDGEVEKLSASLTGEINGVAADLTAASGSANASFSAVYTKFNDYGTSAQTNASIDAAKDAAIGAASAYTDGEIATVTGLINGVAANLTAASGSANASFTAVHTKFNDYDTKTQVADAIKDAKDDVYASANTYTDGEIAAVNGVINGVAADLTALSGYVETMQDELEGAIADAVSKAYIYKDSVASYDQLPTGLTLDNTGWVYNVVGESNVEGEVYPAGTNFAWNGEKWDALGGIVDLSPFAKAEDVTKDVQNINAKIEGFSGATVTRFNGIDTKFNDYGTSAQTNASIDAAKVEVYASAATYTDGEIATVNGLINGVAANLTAASGSANASFTAVHTKFNDYGTSAQTNASIDAAKAAAIGAASAYTDGEIAVVDGKITALDSRIDTLEGLSATTQSAVQDVVIKNLEGIESGRTGNVITFDFNNVTIDCGNF